MKRMTSAEARQAFLDYFEKQGHQIVQSSPLVPGNDPTLLFTNAGMVQFKDVFLGYEKRPYLRATTSQKCMRISGKHNDLENVGPSPRHHTFFEMLGNFSFGDYFKHDGIRFAYEILTEVYKLPPDRLAFTVYESDDEAYDIWVNDIGVDPARVARMGPSTNFWQMADTGPCGPTSEIHWDNTPEEGTSEMIDKLIAEDDRFLELWNLVFMQYNRTQADEQHTGKYDDPLPAPGVDTGLGLERLVAVLQEVEANYDTDIFTDIMDATQEILNHDDEFRAKNTVAYRVIADHTRAASFLIADGVNPGNTGREYIVRMLIRRAMRFAHRMGVEQPFLHQVADAVIYKMSDVFPELKQGQEAIRRYTKIEEESFLRTLEKSLGLLDTKIEEMQKNKISEMTGDEAFFLFSTHGLPLEITRDILQEEGLSVNEAEFDAARTRHSETSGDITDEITDQSGFAALLQELKSSGKLEENGVSYNPYDYDRLSVKTEIVALLVNGEPADRIEYGSKDTAQIVLKATPFYVQSGGQVSDTGRITSEGWEITVKDVSQPVSGLILHSGKLTSGDSASVGDKATATVDEHRRWDIMRNHTATHLLHASLRETLGKHVQQKGSLVAPDRLRFDFSHDGKLSNDELNQINQQVNAAILSNEQVVIVTKSLEEARGEGAMALFGEKYGDTVRTVTVSEKAGNSRWSYELCGGTHVLSTAEIGSFIITAEASSAGGVRRITAITGNEALRVTQERFNHLEGLARQLGTTPDGIEPKVEELLGNLNEANKELGQLRKESAEEQLETLLENAASIDEVKIVRGQVEASDADILGTMADWCRDRIESGVVVLGSDTEGKALLVVKITPNLVKQGVHAGNLIKALAQQVGGGGGGRPDFATAGGKNPAQLSKAMDSVESLVAEMLN